MANDPAPHLCLPPSLCDQCLAKLEELREDLTEVGRMMLSAGEDPASLLAVADAADRANAKLRAIGLPELFDNVEIRKLRARVATA